MYQTININDNQNVKIPFNESNCDIILNKFEYLNEKNNKKYSDEDIQKLNDALKMLSDSYMSVELEGFIDEIDISEDELKEAYEECCENNSYQKGYDEAVNRFEQRKRYINLVNGCLLQKLERLAYGYGKQEALNDSEIKKLKDIVDLTLEEL